MARRVLGMQPSSEDLRAGQAARTPARRRLGVAGVCMGALPDSNMQSALGELTYERSTTNGFTSMCNVPGPGDAEHHHWMCCNPSCSGFTSGDPASSDFASLDFLSSRSACPAHPFRHPSDRGPSAVYIPSLYDR